MTDRNDFEKMLEALLNEDHNAARDIFHSIVVNKSRKIYETLLAEEFEDESEFGGDEESDENDESDEDSETEIGDEEGDDDSEEELTFGDEESEGDVESRVMDLEDELEALKAEVERLIGSDESEEFGGDELNDESEDDFGGEEEFGDTMGLEEPEKDLDEYGQPIYEYKHQVGGKTYDKFGKMGDAGTNSKSPVAGKNDMGGTAGNFARTGKNPTVEANKGQLAGRGVFKGTPKDINSGNVNVPGGNKIKPKSVPAPKKAADADNKRSIVSGKK